MGKIIYHKNIAFSAFFLLEQVVEQTMTVNPNDRHHEILTSADTIQEKSERNARHYLWDTETSQPIENGAGEWRTSHKRGTWSNNFLWRFQTMENMVTGNSTKQRKLKWQKKLKAG